MKERPILFSAEMVKAILAGRKTQTRRIFKGLTPPDCIGNHSCVVEDGVAKFHLNERLAMHEGEWTKCPYGKPGDRLWVRETWRTDASLDRKSPRLFTKWPVEYLADGCRLEHGATYGHTDGKPRPSIFMPRWASRITLEITGVRVERLQEISEEDAKAEGVDRACSDPYEIAAAESCDDPGYFSPTSYSEGFELAWNEINGKHASWASNPWVWVVEFRVEATGLQTVEAA